MMKRPEKIIDVVRAEMARIDAPLPVKPRAARGSRVLARRRALVDALQARIAAMAEMAGKRGFSDIANDYANLTANIAELIAQDATTPRAKPMGVDGNDHIGEAIWAKLAETKLLVIDKIEMIPELFHPQHPARLTAQETEGLLTAGILIIQAAVLSEHFGTPEERIAAVFDYPVSTSVGYRLETE